MKNHLQSEKGISLIMTLVMLVVVGILVGAFMRASVFNLNFSQKELDQKRAFYAAEAGVEHLQSMGGNNVYNQFIKNNSENIIHIIPSDNDNSYVELQYENNENLDVKYKVFYNRDSGYFESKGIVNSGYGEFQQSIIFEFKKGADIMTMLYAFGADTLYEAKSTHESKNNNEPGVGSQWETYWDDIKSGREEIEEYIDSIDEDITDIDIWQRDKEYFEDDLVFNLVDQSGADGDYSIDLINLFDYNFDGYEEYDINSEDYEEGNWSDFLDVFYQLAKHENSSFLPHMPDYVIEELDENGRFPIEEYGTIKDDVENYYREFSPIAEIGDDEIEVFDIDHDYYKEDVVEYNSYYYEAKKDYPEGYPDESNDWDRLDSGDRWAGAEVKDSVIIIDGDLEVSNVTLTNSLILVRGQIDFKGTQTFDSSLMVGFNDFEEDGAHAISGNPSINIERLIAESTYEEWPIIGDIIAEYVDSVPTDELEYWKVN